MSDPSTSDPLELTTLDSTSLFNALSNVEKAIPDLLLCIKPILSHLVSSSEPEAEEQGGMAARDSVERYMDLLDKMQFVLRQTVYYLHETKASPSTLRPPQPNNIPTPFASTLPSSDREEEVELGLYGKRIEVKVLEEMVSALARMKEEQSGNGEEADEKLKAEEEKEDVSRMDVDSHSPG
ncbi:hypothetical protein P7C73_g3271, partial [Tremellales sp. Uapishka_1]